MDESPNIGILKERYELDMYIVKLKAFIREHRLDPALPNTHQVLLDNQLAVMERYRDILNTRLAMFEDE